MSEKKYSENYHAYDGSSRSVPLALSDSLSGVAPLSVPVTREDVVVPGARVFLLHGLLSDEECNYLVNATESIGYDLHSDVKNEYPADYRSNQRLVILSKPFADTIWRRVQPHLHYKDIEHIKPLGWATEGLWLPNHVNDGFLFSRYKTGNLFRPHYDGMYKNEYEECSVYSITVYLNDNYTGGRVLFLKNKDSSSDEEALYKFQPKKGTALVFNHDTLHAGEEVYSGVKYIFRTGIMFRQVENLSDPNKGWEKDPLWIRNREVFKTFTSLGKEGNPEKFTKTFLELQQIQLEHGRSLTKVDKVLLGFSEELLFHTFSSLPLKDLLQLAQVCKSWLTIARNGILWRKIYARMWGEEAARYIQDSISGNLKIDPAIQQWHAIYKKRSLVEATDAPLIIFVSYDVYGCLSQGADTKYFKPFHAKASVESDPWDNSYDTYSIGSGDCWCRKSKKDKLYFHSHVYSELVKAATYRANAQKGKHPWNPHPFIIIYERNAWSSSLQQSVLSQVKRTLENDAFAFVQAPLCSLYAKRLSDGLTVGLEMCDQVCVRAWQNRDELSELEAKLVIAKKRVENPPSAASLAQTIFDMVSSVYKAAKGGPISQSVVINSKGSTRRVGKLFREVVPLLATSLHSHKWNVLYCDEIEVLKGAQMIGGMASFQSLIQWKTKLFEEAVKGRKVPSDHTYAGTKPKIGEGGRLIGRKQAAREVGEEEEEEDERDDSDGDVWSIGYEYTAQHYTQYDVEEEEDRRGYGEEDQYDEHGEDGGGGEEDDENGGSGSGSGDGSNGEDEGGEV